MRQNNLLKISNIIKFIFLFGIFFMSGSYAWAQDCFFDPDILPRAINESFEFDPVVKDFGPGEFCDNISVAQRGTAGITFHDFWDKDCNPLHGHIRIHEEGTYQAGDRVVEYEIRFLGKGEEGESGCEGDVCKECSNTFQAGVIRRTTIPGPPVKKINDAGLQEGEECSYFDREGHRVPPFFTFEPTHTGGVDGDFFPKHVEATCQYLEGQ